MTYDDSLTITEAARLARVDEATIRAWLEWGLPHTEEEGEVRILRSDLETFLLQHHQR